MDSLRLKNIANFAINYLQFLDENSQVSQAFPKFATEETLLEIYRLMSLTRALDNKAVNLQRTGKMGTYPSSQGQEAVGVGIGHAMKAEDIFCPYYRDQATFIQRNIKLAEILSFWGGDERGSHFENNKEDLPICIPIATQCLHAAGIAYAVKYRKQKRAVVTVCGDGGTSKGDFYEALNLAGAWNLPLVFIVNNNQWAISVPRGSQTHCTTLAQKAIAGEITGLQVDGNDAIAVRHATALCLEQARCGKGPSLIETVTYRLCDHTTADDASRYVPKEEQKEAWRCEPIARLGHYLENHGLWSRDKEASLQQEIKQEVEAATQEFLNKVKQSPTSMFDFLYAQLPDALLDQYDQVGEDAS